MSPETGSSQRYSQNCVKQPYKTIHILAFQTCGCLLLHDSSAESSNDMQLSALFSFSNKQPPVIAT